MPRSAPTSSTPTLGPASASACASASAGMRWPPVPPPASNTFTATRPHASAECGVRSAECSNDRSATRPGTSTPHSAFRTPHLVHHAAPLVRRRPCPTLISTPVATSATSRLERPYEMNGKVIPVAGSSARFTPMWSAAVTPISAVSPTASSWPNGSPAERADRKSTRLNSSHGYISYAVFCLKKKKTNVNNTNFQQHHSCTPQTVVTRNAFVGPHLTHEPFYAIAIATQYRLSHHQAVLLTIVA